MCALLAGILFRLVPGAGFLFLGTALAGAAIATANVLVPVIVRRDFPDRTGTAMALYTTSLIGFAALAAGVTVPLADWLGGGWRVGLGVWAVPAALAALAWLPALMRRDAATDAPAPRSPVVRPLLRRPLAWWVTLFFALQSGGFYATLAWLPDIFRSHGASESHAGFLLSLTMVVGLTTAATMPCLATRGAISAGGRRLLGLIAVGLAGILVAPMSASYPVGGAARPRAERRLPAGDDADRAARWDRRHHRGPLHPRPIGRLRAGSVAPLAVGAIHGVTGSWTLPLVLLLILILPQRSSGSPPAETASSHRRRRRPPRHPASSLPLSRNRGRNP